MEKKTKIQARNVKPGDKFAHEVTGGVFVRADKVDTHYGITGIENRDHGWFEFFPTTRVSVVRKG